VSFKGNRQLTILFTCGPEAEAEGDAVFESHAAWMERTHYKEGDKALLMYTVTKGPELSNPLDPASPPTGNMMFSLTEIYAKRAGVEDHWQQALRNWEGFEAFAAWVLKCKIITLHGSEIVQCLW